MSVSKEPLSIRNNNPGNLRFVGQEGATQGEGGFARFDSPEAGMAAMRRQLELDTQERGMTLSAFLNKYAPPSENKTTNYIDFVAKKTGLDPSSVVPADRIGDLQRAMIEMEGGPRSLGHFMQTKVAQAPKATTKPGPRTTAQAPKVAMRDLTQMPESYRAALAANYLADTEGETDVTSKAMELLDEAGLTGGSGGGASGGKVLQKFYAQPSVDPFQFVQAQEEAPRRAVPRMPVRMKDGGEVENEFSAEDRLQQLEMQRDRIAGGLRYDFGPMSAQAVRKPQGYEARVSTPVGPVMPYVDFDPLSGSFRPTEVGAVTGQMGPQGGYTLKYAQPFVDGQQMPPQISGAYRKQFDKDSSLEASGFYSPISGGKDAYGANLRYVQRFAEGGQAQQFTDEQVADYLRAAPGMSDRQIADAMRQFNVSQEQVSRATGVALPEVQRRYLEATTVPVRPSLEGIGALWNKQHQAQFGQPVNLATTNEANVLTQLGELQKETARQQAEWDKTYGTTAEAKALAANALPSWGNIYGNWAQLHQKQYGRMIDRPWETDVESQRQKEALDKQYLDALQQYNTKYGTNFRPEESVLGVNAQPNPFYRVPDKDDNGLGAFLGMAGTIGGMYLFPGMDFNSMVYRNLLSTAATEGGKRLFKDGGEVNRRVPSISEVPQVDVQGRVVRDAPVPQPTFTPGQQLIGAGETALSALSGLTAPASIAYDVLRGVPAKEVSPGRFMYEPRTEAGQETLQNVGRLAQEYKLDAALPQVQLQRPYPVGAAARQGIAGVEKGVEKMTLPTFRKITGNPEATKEQMMDFVLNQKSIMQAGAPAISRAPGGTFFASEGSQLSKLISRGATQAMESAGGDVEKATAAAEMFNKKARDFFEKRAGSISDELKKEMIAGRIKMPGEVGEELFPKYLIKEAEAGDISAMRDLERRYDKMLGIRQINLPKQDIADVYAETDRMSQSIKQNILAQFKQHPELIPDDLLYKLTNKDPTDVRLRLKDNPEYFSTVLEPKISKLISINAESINPSDIARYEGMYGRYATENLSKNELEALKRGQPILDISSGYMELFGYDIRDLARQAGKMSTQELKDINFATFVSRASKLAVKQKTLEARADEIQQSLKSNKPVDPEALAFGTEVFQELPDGSTWRKIVDPDATLIQSAVLDNSIKGYANYGSYGPFNNGRKALEDGNVELFVLYDKNGMPVTNVEMVKGEKSGKFSMRQAQGNGPLTSNVTPEDYLPQLKAFINKTTPEDIPFNISKELRYVDAPEGFAKGGIVDKPLYDRAA